MAAFTDPFLQSFALRPEAGARAREGVFTIGRTGSSIALTDQMVRAVMLVDRLHAAGELTRGTRVCVVGAGFGGATAAVRAAERGAAHVRIVDRAKHAFARQLRCTSRLVDPTEYHWPYPWFRASRFRCGASCRFRSSS